MSAVHPDAAGLADAISKDIVLWMAMQQFVVLPYEMRERAHRFIDQLAKEHRRRTLMLMRVQLDEEQRLLGYAFEPLLAPNTER